ncbi:MAG: O-antigen ligase family protein [Dokdonella sp.]
MNTDAASAIADRFLLMAAAGLLVWCFLFGGDSSRSNPGMMVAELLAIPLLLAALVQCARRGSLSSARWGAFAALLILLLPVVQLLPMPDSLWSLSSDRVQLLQDLNAVGVTAVDTRWTLSPSATERAIYFLLPGMALFFCMLGVGRSAWRQMLNLIVILCVANLVLGFAQMIAGKNSVLNPYPQYAPYLGGIFANRNHQADLLAIGLMLVASFLLDAWYRRSTDRHAGRTIGLLALMAVAFVFSLPLAGSRAGVIVAMVMLLGVLLSSGLPSLNAFRRSRSLQAGGVVAFFVFATGLYAAFAWTTADVAIEGSRHTLLVETLRIGGEQAPWGSGIGTFVQTFQRGAGDALLMHEFVNNAHNEYAQWWLEAGVAGVLVVALVLMILAKTLVTLLRRRQESEARLCGIAAIMGMGVVILHSTVDYPLRTQSLLAVFAVLAGIAVAAASSQSSSGWIRRAGDPPADAVRVPRSRLPARR